MEQENSYNQLITEFKNNDSSVNVNGSAIASRDSQDTAGLDAIKGNLENWSNENPTYDDFVTEEYHKVGSDRLSSFTSKLSRLTYYRSIARHPDISYILDEYKNEILIPDNQDDLCSFLYTKYGDINVPQEMRASISKTADYIKDSVVDFNTVAEDLLMEYLVDGELYFEIKLDAENKRVIGLRKIMPEFIDPLYKKGSVLTYVEKVAEYDENGTIEDTDDVILHHPSKIIYINSGIFERQNKNIVYSMIERARKPFNQLLSMESSLVIRRLTRSPLMNVFNVNVNKMNPADAQNYVKKLARTYKSKSVYDVNTGDFSNRDEFLTSIKNYWFPKFQGDEGTTISTESFDTNFDEIGDVRFFETKLYKVMGIPRDRVEDGEGSYSYDDTAKQQREISFNIKAGKWGKKFTQILYKPFVFQLFLDNRSDNVKWVKNYNFKLTENEIYKLYKELEVLKTRTENVITLQSAFEDPNLINDYYIMKEILHKSDDEIKLMYDDAVSNAKLQYTLEKKIEFERMIIDLEFEKKTREYEQKNADESFDDPEDSDDSIDDMERPSIGSDTKPDSGNADGYEPQGLQMGRDGGITSAFDNKETDIGGENDTEDDVTQREKDFDFDDREATAYDETDEEKAIDDE